MEKKMTVKIPQRPSLRHSKGFANWSPTAMRRWHLANPRSYLARGSAVVHAF